MQTAVPDERAAHAAVTCPEGIPFIAFEGCRERLGAHATFYPWHSSAHCTSAVQRVASTAEQEMIAPHVHGKSLGKDSAVRLPLTGGLYECTAFSVTRDRVTMFFVCSILGLWFPAQTQKACADGDARSFPAS